MALTGYLESSTSGLTIYNNERILLRLLHHQFTSIPETVIQRIEATSDQTQLEAWIEIALTVADLTELDDFTLKGKCLTISQLPQPKNARYTERFWVVLPH